MHIYLFINTFILIVFYFIYFYLLLDLYIYKYLCNQFIMHILFISRLFASCYNFFMILYRKITVDNRYIIAIKNLNIYRYIYKNYIKYIQSIFYIKYIQNIQENVELSA